VRYYNIDYHYKLTVIITGNRRYGDNREKLHDTEMITVKRIVTIIWNSVSVSCI